MVFRAYFLMSEKLCVCIFSSVSIAPVFVLKIKSIFYFAFLCGVNTLPIHNWKSLAFERIHMENFNRKKKKHLHGIEYNVLPKFY